MTIRATQFGTLALVILAAALGVFMITSAARAIRQGGATHKTGPSSSGPDATDGTGDPGAAPDGEAAPDGSVAGDHAEQQAGQQAAGRAEQQAGHQAAGRAEQQAAGRARNSADHDPTEETDELAGAPGRADKG
jgi:hypothetical protein